MRAPKKLSKADQDIWDHVRASVKPVKEVNVSKFEEMLDEDVQPLFSKSTSSKILPSARQQISLNEIVPNTDPHSMQKSKRRALNRGQLEPTARIDLHGLKLEDAREAFNRFVGIKTKEQHKMLLVITGRGGNVRRTEFGEEVSGIIKRAFPLWVQDQNIAKLVSHYCSAHIRHGGEGAFYIFTRARARRSF